MGLSPIFVERVFDTVQSINRQGVTIFMVEQNANLALDLADRAYLLETGRVAFHGAPSAVRADEAVRRVYLGY